MGIVAAVCVSQSKGEPKRPVAEAVAVPESGLEGDAHAGPWHRQVSLLADETVDLMRAHGLTLGPGDFGENLLTRAIDLDLATVGSTIRVGEAVLLEVTQRGKECREPCAIGRRLGTCIMPSHGLFARVVRGGCIRAGDAIEYDTLVV